MTTYAVLASNCFTGAHIVDALLDEPGARVIGVSRAPEYDPIFLPYRQPGRDSARFQFHSIDMVREPETLFALLDAERPEVVINVAAHSEVALSFLRPVEYFEINTTAVVRLCDHLRRQNYLRQYVHISSAEMLGSCPHPMDERSPFNPSTPYAVSKAAADMFLDTFIRNFGFPATMIRSTNVYGRHQQLFKIIPRAAIYIKLGRIIELHGGGGAVKSFIHIRDVVDGLIRSVHRGKTGTFHLSTSNPLTVADVVRLVCELMGVDFATATRIVGERPGQDSRYQLDCGRAERELDWAAQVDFTEGVRETIAWVEANWNAIQNMPLDYQHRSSSKD